MKTLFLFLLAGTLAFSQTAVKRQNDGTLKCTSAGASGTAYTCTTSPSFTPAAGDTVTFCPDVANTASATLNVNSTSARTIKKQQGASNLVANDLQASPACVLLVLDQTPTNWILSTPNGNGGSAQPCAFGSSANFNPATNLDWVMGTDGLNANGASSTIITSSAASIKYYCTMLSAGTLTKLVANISAAPGAALSWVITVWYAATGTAATNITGASATSITCTITGTTALECSDVAHSQAYALGDTFTILWVASSSSVASMVPLAAIQ